MRLALVISALVAVLIAGLLILGDSLEEWLLSGEGLEWLRAHGRLSGLVGAGLIAADLFLPIPATGVMAALGEIHGAFVGGLYGTLGTVTAGLLAYGLVRALGARAAEWIAGAENLARLQRFFEARGAWAIALTRPLPMVPEVLSCLAGLAPMSFPRYLVALLGGCVPFSFAFASLGSLGQEQPVTTFLVASLLPFAIFPPLWWWMQRTESSTPSD